MQNTMKSIVVGALALAGAALATSEVQAMPVQQLSPTVSSPVEQVYYYGYRRPFLRYGFRRPFLGYRRFGYRPYGFRRPFYGYRRPFYGYRRPFYGYGYRRF